MLPSARWAESADRPISRLSGSSRRVGLSAVLAGRVGGSSCRPSPGVGRRSAVRRPRSRFWRPRTMPDLRSVPVDRSAAIAQWRYLGSAASLDDLPRLGPCRTRRNSAVPRPGFSWTCQRQTRLFARGTEPLPRAARPTLPDPAPDRSRRSRGGGWRDPGDCRAVGSALDLTRVAVSRETRGRTRLSNNARASGGCLGSEPLARPGQPPGTCPATSRPGPDPAAMVAGLTPAGPDNAGEPE